MMKYKIEFTEKQLRVVAKGLEFYSRFLAGQWKIPLEMANQEYINQNKRENFWHDKHDIEKQLNILFSKLTKQPLNMTYGIGSDKPHEDTNIAYDIYRPIWEELVGKGNDWNVYSSPGLSYSKEGRIEIEKNH